jgi:hypothetical protein
MGGRTPEPGQDRGSGNAGLWFMWMSRREGETYEWNLDSFHMNTVHLTNNDITVEVFRPYQVTQFENGATPTPVHRYKWDLNEEKWFLFDPYADDWVSYVKATP